MEPCIVERCDNEAKAARGMCWTHYQRIRRHGDLAPTRRQRPLPAVLKERGITYRQFDYWASLGLLPGVPRNPGYGTHRGTLTDQCLLILEIVGELSALGINVQGEFVRQVIESIERGDESRTVGRLTINLKSLSTPCTKENDV